VGTGCRKGGGECELNWDILKFWKNECDAQDVDSRQIQSM